MKWLRSLLAICMALILVVAPCSTGWADLISPTDTSDGNPVDSGHPWDDEATEGTDPGDDEGDQTVVRGRDDLNQYTPSLAVVMSSGNRWLGEAVVHIWQRIFTAGVVNKLKTIGFRR